MCVEYSLIIVDGVCVEFLLMSIIVDCVCGVFVDVDYS